MLITTQPWCFRDFCILTFYIQYQFTCELNTLIHMLHSVMCFEYDGVDEGLGLCTEGAVHVGRLVGAVRRHALNRLIVVLRALNTNTGMSLKRKMTLYENH